MAIMIERPLEQPRGRKTPTGTAQRAKGITPTAQVTGNDKQWALDYHHAVEVISRYRDFLSADDAAGEMEASESCVNLLASRLADRPDYGSYDRFPAENGCDEASDPLWELTQGLNQLSRRLAAQVLGLASTEELTKSDARLMSSGLKQLIEGLKELNRDISRFIQPDRTET